MSISLFWQRLIESQLPDTDDNLRGYFDRYMSHTVLLHHSFSVAAGNVTHSALVRRTTQTVTQGFAFAGRVPYCY